MLVSDLKYLKIFKWIGSAVGSDLMTAYCDCSSIARQGFMNPKVPYLTIMFHLEIKDNFHRIVTFTKWFVPLTICRLYSKIFTLLGSFPDCSVMKVFTVGSKRSLNSCGGTSDADSPPGRIRLMVNCNYSLCEISP